MEVYTNEELTREVLYVKKILFRFISATFLVLFIAFLYVMGAGNP